MGFFKFLSKRNKPNQSSLSKNLKQSGNVFMMLFAAVGMVGVIGAATMTVMKGPVKTMSQVTKRTIAENNMIAAGKLAVIAASQAANDCDTDNTIEPFEYAATIPGFTGGGTIPSNIGVSKEDPWGTEYGYCVWDHGSAVDDAGCGGGTQNRLAGADVADEYVLAIISAGPDGNFNTTCNDYVDVAPADGEPDTLLLDKTGGSDDIILGYTYAEAGAIAGGLWTEVGADEATIARDISIKDKTTNTTETFGFDSDLGNLSIGGTGQFPTVGTDNLQAFTGVGGSIDVLSALSSDSDITTSANISGEDLAASGALGVTGISTLGVLNAGAAKVTSLDAGSGAITTTGTLGAGASTLDSATITTTLNVGGNTTLGDAPSDTVTTAGTLTMGGNIILGANYLSGDGGNEGIAVDSTGKVAVGSNDTDGTFTITSAPDINSANSEGQGGLVIQDNAGNATDIKMRIDSNEIQTSNNGVASALNINRYGGGVSIGVLGNSNLSLNLGKIINLADPTAAQDAATKAYVDTNIAAGTGFTETDPQVGTLTAGKWCVSNGGATAVDCTADLPGETDPQVGTLTAGRWCTTDGTDIDCTTTAPGGAGTSAGNLVDADDDTKVEVEKNADEDIIRFTIGGKETMGIYNATNWGINALEVTPSFVVHAAGTHGANVSSISIRSSSSSNGGNYLLFGSKNNKNVNYGQIGTHGADSLISHSLSLEALGARDIKFSTNTTERMRINSAGNVGIGDTTPDGTLKLDVEGQIGATEYCDENGADCTTAAAIAAAAAGGAGTIDDLTDAASTGDVDPWNLMIGHNVAPGANDKYNTAVGLNALDSLSNSATGTEGWYNTAIGYNALTANTTGIQNTASGFEALRYNTTGSNNTASGMNALNFNTTGIQNTASGVVSLRDNTTGSHNTASGVNALRSNTTGSNNTASGRTALYANTTGDNNTASGVAAGRFIADGTTANETADNSLFLGYNTKANADGETNQIVIGAGAIGNGSNSVTLGADTITKTILRGSVLMENDGVCTAAEKGAIRLNAAADGLEMCDGVSAWNDFSSSSATTALSLVDADNDTKIQVEESADDDTIRFDTAGVERMIIDNNGKIGLGTTGVLSKKLEVIGGIRSANYNVTAGTGGQYLEMDPGKLLLVRPTDGTFGTVNGYIDFSDQTTTSFGRIYFDESKKTFNVTGIATGGSVQLKTNGSIIPGASLCLLDTEGGIQYTSGNKLEFCDGIAWQKISLGTTALSLVDADNDTKIQVEESADDDTIRFDTAGTERMVISPTGNIAIGSSVINDTALLTITGNDGKLIIEDQDGAAKIRLHNNISTPPADTLIGSVTFSGKNSVAATVGYSLVNSYALDDTSGLEEGYITFDTLSAGATVERMRVSAAGIDARSGKIISLADPTAAQDAATKAYVDTAISSGNADTVDSLHAASFIRSDASDFVTANTQWEDNYNIRLGSDTDFRMWFDGTDMHMRSYTNNARWILRGQSSAGALRDLIAADPNASVVLYHNGISRLSTSANGIQLNGRITDMVDPLVAQDATTKNYVDTAVSDRRLKKDVVAMTDYGLDTIMALRPVNYNWINPTDNVQQGKQFGFIAQEVGEVIPELIITKDDEMKTVTYKHRELTSILTKAVQELKGMFEDLKEMVLGNTARIEKLEAENEALKNRLDALEAKMAE